MNSSSKTTRFALTALCIAAACALGACASKPAAKPAPGGTSMGGPGKLNEPVLKTAQPSQPSSTVVATPPVPAKPAAPTTPANATPLSNSKTQSDQSIQTDHDGYAKQQTAIKTVNDTGKHRVASYSLSKAQCWLDVSLHEYSRNDRSSFPQEAMNESVKITQFLKNGGLPTDSANPAHLTPLVNKAAKLRPDLWDTAGKFKTMNGFECVEKLVSCAEVELVHAGNEHNQQGWRHAKPYVQIAEDLLAQAEQGMQACKPPPAPEAPKAPAKPEPVAMPAATMEKVSLSASALFKFNKRGPADLLPQGKAELNELAQKLKTGYARVDGIDLVGYTDRLGSQPYNAKLSLDRANTVKAYLQSQGVTAPITTQGKGPLEPKVNCPGNKPNKTLTDCLQPNRRVEVGILGVKR
jgi:OmpA-OmpF porin, OOP family